MKKRQAGFTLVELIMTVVIVGIISVVAIPRFFDADVFRQRGFADQVKATLRYAQKAAIAQHRFVCVTFAAHSLTLTQGVNATCGGNLASPTGDATYLISNNSILITAPAAGNISFDCLGRPRTVGDPAATCVPGNVVGVLTAKQTVQVQDAPEINIEAETGYVH